jgi:hypothetical protein
MSLTNSIHIPSLIKAPNSFILKAKQLLYALRNYINRRLSPLISLGPINGSQVPLVDTLKEENECRNPSLGLVTKAKRSQGCGPRRVWKWRLTLPSKLSFWELESWWTLEPSERDCKGQNTLHWGVLYIIRSLLKCRCLKWACMTCLNIYNTSYGKKKGRESNW